MNQWIGTANKPYANYAMEELRRLIGEASFQQLAAGEVFLMNTPLDKAEVQRIIHEQEPIFLRHIQPVDRTIAITGTAADLEELTGMVRNARLLFADKRSAVHVRKTAGSPFPYSAADTKSVIDAVLEEVESDPSLQNPDIILAIYAGVDKLYAGFAAPADMLSDWPGGAVRFQREENQISRAKFKLLEAEKKFGLHYEQFYEALDIGAAPGGWTSLLLERGLRVTAIDPANMHPDLLHYPTLIHHKCNAADVKLDKKRYNLLVCDMSWSPMLMSKLVLDLDYALKENATLIITIKLMHKKPLQTIREVIERLAQKFELVQAKQLFHNREEITLYLLKK